MSDLPTGWVEEKLGSLCSITTGKKDVNEGNPSGEFPFFTCSRNHTWSDSYSFDTEAILIAGNGDVGWLNYYSGKFEAYQRTYVLSGFQVSTAYLRHYISGGLRKRLERQHAGSVIQFIKFSDLDDFPVRLPKQGVEQRLIAHILDTLDTQIHKTEALIAKLEKVKEGLLHDLLTRGIDESGRLRPSPEQAPELYKESPLGLIPKEWVCERLKWFVPTIDYGISTSLSDKGEAPVLRMNNIQNGEAELSSLKFTEEHKINGLELRYGDVLFNRTNSLEHVGRTGIWREQITKAGFASYLVRLNNDKKILNEEYLNFWLNLKETKNRMKRYATPGVHQVNVNPTNLRKVYMAAPSDIKEQLRVVDILLESNHGLQKEQCLVEKLKSKKLALMDDLLTGRVRVTPLLDQAQTTTPA